MIDATLTRKTHTGGEDYNLTESQLQFNANHYNDCVNIIIINDDVLEDRERFTVMLSGADSEDVRVSNQQVTVEIEDDDCKCSIGAFLC